ncbi:lytic transglycosylase domain-containing protein [Massilia sp. CCM 9210]|uniref:lytic transglycosylase domain-containing protein n=1 Tax=Massilia scottii TaxID=3057166 RepID=UPI00279641FB|nr:lytic transglycosylase domain-containing protein [Massilia sp. CCM 9210]MDQ1815808.1 lytic transglycosylase domain-containing protein [Massilia sp. CCM 9210]
MIDFVFLAQQCAPGVHVDTMQRIVRVESSFNPYAIGVVGGRLERQPRNSGEALATAQWLEKNGYNFSMGLAQVNKRNLAKYGLTLATAFDPCRNLSAGSAILADCYQRAGKTGRSQQDALRAAFSCYYSGNFISGFRLGYVLKVVGAGGGGSAPSPRIALNQAPSVGAANRPLRSRRDSGSTLRMASDPGSTSGQAAAVSPQSNSALLF